MLWLNLLGISAQYYYTHKMLFRADQVTRLKSKSNEMPAVQQSEDHCASVTTQCNGALSSINQSISRFLKWPKWCNHCKDHYVSRWCQDMTAGIRNVITVDGRWTASLPQRRQLAVYSRCVEPQPQLAASHKLILWYGFYVLHNVLFVYFCIFSFFHIVFLFVYLVVRIS